MRTAAASRAVDCGQDVAGFEPIHADAAAESVGARFRRIAARYPERPALRTRRGALTYAELDRATAAIAHALLARGTAPESVIAFLDSDIAAAGAFVGTVRAGKRYVPIEPRLPDARVGAIIADAEATVALTDAAHRDRLRRVAPAGLSIIDLDPRGDLAPADAVHEPAVPLRAHAWIVYTSGSTGQPKGVLQTHGNLAQYVQTWVNALRMSPLDRLASMFTLSVNGGLHDLLIALGTGACHLGWDPARDGVADIGGWLRAERATIYSSVATVFRRVAAALAEDERFPDVRLVRLWGEPAYRRDFEAYRRHFSDASRLVNRLGASETGSIRWNFLSRADEVAGNALPIGWDAPGVRTELVDAAGRPVSPGEVGELVAIGRFLSPGYWRRPELTAAAFADDPEDPGARRYRTGDLGRLLPDGCCVHMGRTDFQVKVRGNRVELDEIEQTLLRHPGVAEAVVVGVRADEDETRLVAYVVPRPGAAPTVTSLRQLLAAELPSAMLPMAFVALPALPQAPNGKVDRRALPAPDRVRPVLDVAYREPANDIERLVAGIWREVLDLDAVGADDNFLDLGGDSLRAMRVMSRLRPEIPEDIPLHALLEAPTVADTARLIRRHRG